MRSLATAAAELAIQRKRATTARKKKRAGAKGKTVVANTKAGRVTKKFTKR